MPSKLTIGTYLSIFRSQLRRRKSLQNLSKIIVYRKKKFQMRRNPQLRRDLKKTRKRKPRK